MSLEAAADSAFDSACQGTALVPSARSRSRGLVFLMSIGSQIVLALGPVRAQTGAVGGNIDARARVREIPPAMREARVNAVTKSPVAGQLVIDPAKIGAVGGAQSRVVASDLAGSSVPVDRLPDGRWSITQDQHKWLVLKPEQSTTLRMQRGLQWLPGVCVPPSSTAGITAGDTYSSYVDFETVPVAWDTEADSYRIAGRVGIAKNSDQKIGGALGTRAVVKFSFEQVAGADAADCALEQIGIDGEQAVDMKFAHTLGDTPALVVRSSVADAQKYLLDVQPRLVLHATRDPILGLGLEQTQVTVSAARANDSALPVGSSQIVGITCEGGSTAGVGHLTISDADPQCSFTLRSMGWGDVHLVASVSAPTQAISGSLTIRQVTPWAQFAAALLGGALGGFARRFVKGARAKNAMRRVVEGLVVGLICFVGGALGVGWNWLPEVVVATIAGAFLTGAITGFTGVTVLEKFGAAKAA